MQTQYEMVHLKKTPVLYSHLSGLLYVFKSKIGQELKPACEIHVSSRFTFVLNDWGVEGAWPVKITDPDTVAKHFSGLLSGCLEDPVVELLLATTWPLQTADVIIDGRAHSNLEALDAPCWSIRMRYADEVQCLLSCYLEEFIKTAERKENLNDLVRFHDPTEETQDIGQALDKLTDPSANTVIPIVPTKLASEISKVVSNPHGFLRRGAYTIGRISMGVERIESGLLQDIMSFIFNGGADSSQARNEDAQDKESLALHHRLKAAPVGSLTHRLAICAIVVNLCHGGVWALAQLWHAFVTELRRMLDSSVCLNGVETTQPDLRAGLLHQKLQMLNCCIFKKTQRDDFSKSSVGEVCAELPRESGVILAPENAAVSEHIVEKFKATETSEAEPKPGESLTGAAEKSNRVPIILSDSEDDEFFECDSIISSTSSEPPKKSSVDEPSTSVRGYVEDDERNSVPNRRSSMSDNVVVDNSKSALDEESNDCDGKKSPRTSLKYEPVGRLRECGDLMLLYESVPLYVPVTQEHPPQTEDQLEEQADIFSKLGDTKEGSKVRAKMQSTSLLSDMESFKAANPGCVLEDFVRWYSPRDFDDGCLSQRMRIPGNLWVTTWSSAKPVPAHRQKRLFDDTKEAEKVLHFLTNLKPAEITQLLLPMCVHESLLKLRTAAETMAACLTSLPLLCEQIEKRAANAFKSWKMCGSISNQFYAWSKDDKTKIEDLVRQISFAENLVERAKSLQHKFKGVGDKDAVDVFVRRVLEHPEVEIEEAGSGVQGCIVKMYFQAQQARLLEATNTELEADPVDLTIPPLPPPTGREFILRTKSPYPSSFSRGLPHRLYAVVTSSEFRLASAVSSDTTFF